MTGDIQTQRLPEWEKSLSAKLETEVAGHPVVAFDTVSSTNDVAKDLATRGAPDGLTVVARAQTQGRGRRGRSWVSFRDKAVYLSILLRPEWKSTEVTWLGVLGGVATAEAVGGVGVDGLLIKWPNDVLADGKKIAGVLVEPRLGDDDLDFAVLGIGVNVAQSVDDWPADLARIATSCRHEGADTDCDAMIIQLLNRLDFWYGRLASGDRKDLLDAWSRWSGSPQLPVLD